MDEDTERFKATSKKITDSIIEAYGKRFPTLTPYNLAVIVKSLTDALVSLLLTLDDENRKKFINIVICSILDARDYE